MAENSKKVVQLSRHTGVKGSSSEDSHLFARLPAPLIDMKDKGQQGLQPLLQALFDNIDDALFELADRAEHNTEQNMYFESMREVRIKRRGMEIGFARELDGAFERLLAGTGVPPVLTHSKQPEVGISADSLSLVGDDELEELVAADTMVAKSERQFNQELKQLTTRMDTLIDVQAVTDKNNPFSPAVVCQAFIAVCRGLDIDIKARLVLFKLFDRYVMNGLGSVYTLCNVLLVENGILPNLARRHSRNSARNPATNDSAEVSSPSVQQEDVFADLQGLLHRQQQEPASSGPATNGLVAPGQAPQIPRESLLQLLQTVQQALLPILDRQQQAALAGASPEQLSIQLALSKILSAKMPSKPMSIGQVDDDAINLVAMLFQFILDDRNLAAPMKALIARLQIPIIKVAMLDKSFFSKGGHPARKLLNEIAQACLGWTASQHIDRDPLYCKVSSVVNRLLGEFDGDVAIFHDILADFVAFVEMDKRRSNLVEQRTVNAEDGKAKFEIARSKVQAALNERVTGKLLPQVVVTLLESAWSNVLFLVYLKEGEEDKNWQESLQVVDDLLWSVAPMVDADSRKRLLKMVPDLLKKLRLGLNKIGYNPFEMNELFADLEVIHLSQLKELNTVQREAPAPPQKAAQTKVIEEALDQMLEQRSADEVSLEALDAELDQQLAEFDALGDLVSQSTDDELKQSPAVVPSLPLPPAEPAQDKFSRQVVDKLQASSVSPEPAAELSKELAKELPAADPCLARVDAMSTGNWVELHQDDEKKFRCRLAAIIRSTGKYIFVNRSGMKVAEYSRMSLAQALKQGLVSALDEGLLFDRALESVIGNLRDMKTTG
jgi:Protein of unknown function (DUF1631)